MIPFDTHSTANLLPLAILKKLKIFFRKTHQFFLRKPKFWTFWVRNHTISVAFYGKFTAIWWKNSHSETWTTAIIGVNAIGKHRFKNVPFERKILHSILQIIWRKIIKYDPLLSIPILGKTEKLLLRNCSITNNSCSGKECFIYIKAQNFLFISQRRKFSLKIMETTIPHWPHIDISLILV